MSRRSILSNVLLLGALASCATAQRTRKPVLHGEDYGIAW